MNKKNFIGFSLIEVLVGMTILAIMTIGIYTFSTDSQKTVGKSANLINFMQSFARLLMYYEKDSMKVILPSDIAKDPASFQVRFDPKILKLKKDGVLSTVEYEYNPEKGSLLRKGADGKKTMLFDSELADLKMTSFLMYYAYTSPAYRPGVYISATYKERKKTIKTFKRIIFFKYNKEVQDTYNSWKYQ